MIYLERTPAAPLNQCVRSLWYTLAPEALEGQERILPNGCIQLIVNLAGDFEHEGVPSLIVGARSEYEIVDRSDMADLIGIVFHPGGFSPFVNDAADAFSHRSVSLEDVWCGRARALRDQLREIPGPNGKLLALERFLNRTFAPRVERNPMVDFALGRFAAAPVISTVGEVAEQTGRSMRHFSQIFREQVGLTPKVWCRVQRFQRAVRQLHAGADIAWAELALDCGYYDQSHFANEFRAFSGIDATSYCARRTRWANHVPVE
jgi:AraC-like DNA-binding protein